MTVERGFGFRGVLGPPDPVSPCHGSPERMRRRFLDPDRGPRAKVSNRAAIDNWAHLSYNVAQYERNAMTANSVVRARVDERDKAEASAVLGAMGLTLSDAFRMLVKRIARDKALPFEPLVPNAETIEAMKAARRGELVTAGKPGDLLASLNADC